MEQTENLCTMQSAVQCAPVLAGIKAANLLILNQADPLTVMKLIDGTGLSCEYLYQGDRRNVWLVYRMEELEEILGRKENQKFLRKLGYRSFTLDDVLNGFRARYQAYLNHAEYPHELGLLLGYPLADVRGFMEHKGKDFLCSGYWKVYENAEEAQQRFAQYTHVRREAARFAQEGKVFREMAAGFRQEFAFSC